MIDYRITIGLVPVRRDVQPRPGIFNIEKADERGRKAVDYIKKNYSNEKIQFIDLDDSTPNGILYDDSGVKKTIKKFKSCGVDGVFIINANFGNEEAAVQVARETGKPVLIWAPLDDVFEKDGTRYTDSQCGIFGLSKQLQRRNVP